MSYIHRVKTIHHDLNQLQAVPSHMTINRDKSFRWDLTVISKAAVSDKACQLMPIICLQ